MIWNWLAASWEHVALVLSALLNVGLVLALFFKSALNTIMAKKYELSRARKDHERQVLIDLHARVKLFSRNYFTVLMMMGTEMLTEGAVSDAAYAKQKDEAASAIKGAVAFIDQHELDFPPTVRALTDLLRSVMSLDDFQNLKEPAAWLQKSNAVEGVCKRLQEEISRLVK